MYSLASTLHHSQLLLFATNKMAEQFTKWYLSRLHAAPRRVKAATYFCTRSLQEFLCRAIQGKQLGSQETLRSVAGMGVYGAVISSTLSIETQRALEACCPKGWVWTRWAMQNFVVMPFLVSASCGCELWCGEVQ